MDMILNGQAQGAVATTLLANGFNVQGLRPWIGKDGRTYIAQNHAGKAIAVPTMNAGALLRKDEWIQLDTAVLVAAKERLRLIADLRAAGLTYTIPNGMGKTVLESETTGDITPATISMDPARQSEGDRPEYDIVNLPLPVIHKDFYFNARQIAVSRNNGVGVDVTMAQLAARKVAEEAEKLAIGIAPGFKYGGGEIFGITNFPHAITTVNLTAPTEAGWTPKKFLTEILAMRQASERAFHYGPWVLYVSSDWDMYLDDDYSDVKGDITVRQRLTSLNGVTEIRTLDYLTGFKVVLMQMTSDVIRLVIGMDITTIQWETLGGMRLNFKVMAIMVPQLRADFNGNSGVVFADAAAS